VKAQAAVIFEISHKEKNYHFVVPAGAPYEDAQEAVKKVIADIQEMHDMAKKGAEERELKADKTVVEPEDTQKVKSFEKVSGGKKSCTKNTTNCKKTSGALA